MNRWDTDNYSDNYLLRSEYIRYADIDILGVTETHLLPQQDLSLSGYTWYGHNRMALHRRAKKGSGGVGFFIRNTILETNKVTILDKIIEGILWIKVSARKSDFVSHFCVCYLPPEGSTHPGITHVSDFFECLLTQIYM